MLALHDAEKLSIRFEIEIDAPPSQVWAQMATVEAMNQWFARNLVFEHEVGGRFQMEGEMPDDGPYKFTGEVVKIVPEKELIFTWKSEITAEGPWPTHTLVSFRLEPSGAGTRVTLAHSGFEKLGARDQSLYESHIQGWMASQVLGSLKEVAEAD